MTDPAAARRELTVAAQDVEAAKERGRSAVAAADERLRAAVDAAREAGVLWGEIGDTLGMRRGNAYQRFRHRGPSLPGAKHNRFA
ncbi:hypothetical protein H7K45_28675 [Mycobacterium yunnanensis]|uniref:Uncharacterized protein n=1 Tax=Mycobacterium yunnanensis TaxID=368477 RepID=A0A9X2Z9S3_9MYCO|nr:hypothetical protein [Mycobacterium yunnanensis]MCV7424524.1 hypothetical protein [Mycobacterium yunnanensis]